MQAGARAVGAVAVTDEAAQDGDGGGKDLLRQQQDTAVACEDPMPGNAPEQHSKIDPRRRRLARPDNDRGEADVVGVLKTPTRPPPSKAIY